MARERLVVAIEGMFAHGGTERQAVEIACGMRRRGHVVTLLSRWPLDRRHHHLAELLADDVQVISRGWAGEGSHRYQRPQVVLSRLISFGRVSALRRHAWRWQAAQLRRLGDVRVVHEVPFFGDLSPQGQAVYRQSRLPVVQSIFGTPASTVPVVVPWAVVTGDGSPKLEPEHHPLMWIPTLGPPSTPLAPRNPPADGVWRVLFVGRLVVSKGADVLLSAWEGLAAPTELTVVGDGPDAARLRELAERLRIHVTFAGALERPGVLRELKRSHVLVAPSLPTQLAEGLPTVLPEAMWAGIPVIASRLGGVAHLFRGDPPGWMVEPGDTAALADALRLAMDRDRYMRAARAAHAVFAQLLSPRAALDRYETAYAAAVSALRGTESPHRGEHVQHTSTGRQPSACPPR